MSAKSTSAPVLKALPLDLIRLDGGTQVRVKTNTDTNGTVELLSARRLR